MPENEELLNEDALFDDAVGDDGIASASREAQPEPAAVEQAAASEPEKEKAVEAVSETDDVEDNGSPVPSSRFRQAQEEKRAARAERDALKQERDRLLGEQQEFRRWMMSQQQQPKPAEPPKQPEEPDPLLDPRGYREHMERRFEDRLLNERREQSLQYARRTYKEEFDEAYQTAQQQVDPALRARMQQSSDPGETLIQWHREMKVRAEVGNDTKAYRDKVRAEFLKDPEFRKAAMEAWRGEASTQVSGRPNVQLPPSMNGISRSSAALRASQSDLSDDDLWDTTTT